MASICPLGSQKQKNRFRTLQFVSLSSAIT
jgi:hypothetical protein